MGGRGGSATVKNGRNLGLAAALLASILGCGRGRATTDRSVPQSAGGTPPVSSSGMAGNQGMAGITGGSGVGAAPGTAGVGGSGGPTSNGAWRSRRRLLRSVSAGSPCGRTRSTSPRPNGTASRPSSHDLASLRPGNDFATRHPVIFHLDGETVTDATIKLHGQSSWVQTVMLDGDRAKMQFDISFDQSDPTGKFHGVDKLVFDMPRSTGRSCTIGSRTPGCGRAGSPPAARPARA